MKGRSCLVGSLVAVLALSSGLATLDAAEPAKRSIGSAITNPIKWLRERSARKRWEKQKAQELLRQAEQQPAVSDTRFEQPLTPIDASGDGGTLTFSGELPAQFVSDESPEPGIATLPEVEPFIPTAISGPGSEADFVEAAYQDAASDPKQLRPITEILPYADYRPEMKVEAGLDPTLKAPREVELSDGEAQPRQMDAILYQWQASNLYHYPLYFEDPALERYGHTHDELVQPFVSIGQFGVQLVGLPYQMTIDPVCKKRYALGWFRPGECAPKQVKQIPWNTKAAINQTAVTTGMWFALP